MINSRTLWKKPVEGGAKGVAIKPFIGPQEALR